MNAEGCILDLSGNWTLTSDDGVVTASYAVPGDVHSALIAAKAIPHPYKGRNELDVRWVAETGWTASREFILDDLLGGTYYLDVTGLDTVASISINSVEVLSAENAFRRYRPVVTGSLQSGANLIEIMFHSNVKVAAEKQATQPFYIPYSVNNCPVPHGNMLRKPHCHFGWDWNLAIVPFGIYGTITLCRMEQLRIEHVVVRQKHKGAGGPVTVDVDVTVNGKGEDDLTLQFAGETKTRRVKAAFGDVVQRFRFVVDEPELWWPVGLGAQHLYNLTVTCGGHVERRRIGLRDMALDTHEGRFAFKVNGHEVFCRGANWIPADALPSQATPALTRKLLRAAVDANMNMVRVWGGGQYEPADFYETCDELGLLVWQDFMFACSLYPSTPEFLNEVKAEVDYQVKRLQHHACIALWCGDNELIGALTWFKESKENRDRYLVNYDRLNRCIEETMKAADSSALWWPSSPSPGILNFGDAWHNDGSGDMHFWSVWHEGKDFEHYHDVSPRFCSEFGFQSFPSMPIVRRFIDSEEDLNIASAVMEHHQRNTGGNARIAETMFRYFRFPMDFSKFVYVSQVQQGHAMRTAVEYWRSLKPHCMGTLYWQLNDTWPVASWSGLDHGGGWKALHYMARRFYAPVVVVAFSEKATGDIVLTAINDGREDVKLRVALRFVPADGEPGVSLSNVVDALGSNPCEVHRIAAADVQKDGVYLFAWESGDGKKGRNHFAVVPYKAIALSPSRLSADFAEDDHLLTVTVSAASLALFVALECDVPGTYSDNYFDLLAGESRSIVFTPEDAAHVQRARDTLILHDLYSSTH
jgi:beta-mannosidase